MRKDNFKSIALNAIKCGNIGLIPKLLSKIVIPDDELIISFINSESSRTFPLLKKYYPTYDEILINGDHIVSYIMKYSFHPKNRVSIDLSNRVAQRINLLRKDFGNRAIIANLRLKLDLIKIYSFLALNPWSYLQMIEDNELCYNRFTLDAVTFTLTVKGEDYLEKIIGENVQLCAPRRW